VTDFTPDGFFGRNRADRIDADHRRPSRCWGSASTSAQSTSTGVLACARSCWILHRDTPKLYSRRRSSGRASSMRLLLSKTRQRESHAQARLASREERSSGRWPITPANRPPLIGEAQPAPVVLIKRRSGGRWLDGVRAGALYTEARKILRALAISDAPGPQPYLPVRGFRFWRTTQPTRYPPGILPGGSCATAPSTPACGAKT
jgi:hypothetical protein